MTSSSELSQSLTSIFTQLATSMPFGCVIRSIHGESNHTVQNEHIHLPLHEYHSTNVSFTTETFQLKSHFFLYRHPLSLFVVSVTCWCLELIKLMIKRGNELQRKAVELECARTRRYWTQVLESGEAGCRFSQVSQLVKTTLLSLLVPLYIRLVLTG